MSALGHLDALERALTAKGFPAMSPWWRATLVRFYASGRRQLVPRVGRRGGKSSSLCRVAVLEAVFGDHKIPPGDVGVVAIISVSRDEAGQRLRTVKAILDALGIRFRPVDGGIELDARPIVFKTFAASISGVSGFTCITAIADEVAKWRDSDTGANPAKEVLASLRPTMATQPRARIFLSSSPLGMHDAHAEAFDRGETDFQCVAHAETWVANPSVTEADTRALEPEDRVWRREYAAIPQAGAVGAFEHDLIDAAVRAVPPVMERISKSCVLLDASAGRGDALVHCVGHFAQEVSASPEFLMLDAVKRDGRSVLVRPSEHRPGDELLFAGATVERDGSGAPLPSPDFRKRSGVRFVVERMHALEGRFGDTIDSDSVMDAIAGTARAAGARTVILDQFSQWTIATSLTRRGLAPLSIAWSSTLKAEACVLMNAWLRDRSLIVEPGAEGEKWGLEMKSMVARILPSGVESISARRGGHDDRAMAVLLGCAASVLGIWPGAPTAPRRQRFEVPAPWEPGGLEQRRVTQLTIQRQ